MGRCAHGAGDVEAEDVGAVAADRLQLQLPSGGVGSEGRWARALRQLPYAVRPLQARMCHNGKK